jgi:hypothetical protein
MTFGESGAAPVNWIDVGRAPFVTCPVHDNDRRHLTVGW